MAIFYGANHKYVKKWEGNNKNYHLCHVFLDLIWILSFKNLEEAIG